MSTSKRYNHKIEVDENDKPLPNKDWESGESFGFIPEEIADFDSDAKMEHIEAAFEVIINFDWTLEIDL